MFNSIRYLDPLQAAGILADTALKLESRTSWAHSAPLVDHQDEVESALLEEVKLILQLDPDDFSENAIEKITDFLDSQAESLVPAEPTNITERLSAQGLLPSDIYNIEFEQNLPNDYGWRWDKEHELAIITIKNPHQHQVLGRGASGDFPALSIYGRFFTHRFRGRSFWLLVIGRREGLNFFVSQVWRAYPSAIDLSECETLLDVVKAIAEKFGYEISLDGRSRKFFWSASLNQAAQAMHDLRIIPHKTDVITVTFFSDGDRAVLVVPMNLSKYFAYVDHWRGWDRNILRDLDLPSVASSLSTLATPDAQEQRP